jgi:hypothetical protein
MMATFKDTISATAPMTVRFRVPEVEVKGKR